MAQKDLWQMLLGQINDLKQLDPIEIAGVTNTPARGIMDFWNGLLKMETTIQKGITAETDSIQTVIDGLEQRLGSRLSVETAEIDNRLNGIVDEIDGGIKSRIGVLQNAVDGIEQRLNYRIENVITEFDNLESGLNTAITGKLADQMLQLVTLEKNATQIVNERIDDRIGELDGVLKGVEREVIQKLELTERRIAEETEETNELIDAKFMAQIEAINQIPGKVGEEFQSVFAGTMPEEIKAGVPEVALMAQGIPMLPAMLMGVMKLGGIFSGFAGLLIAFDIFRELKEAAFGPWLKKLSQFQSSQVRESNIDFGTLLQLFQRGIIGDSTLKEIAGKHGFPNEQIDLAKEAIKQFLALGELTAGVNQSIIPDSIARDQALKLGYTERDYDYLRQMGKKYLSVQDYVAETIRTGGDLTKAFTAAKQQGLEAGDVEIVRKLQQTLLNENDIRQAFLRGFINRETATTKFKQLGWQDNDITTMFNLFTVLPTVSDLVRMAVRETFTPEIAEKFGAYEDFPPEFAQYAAQQGLSEEWAKRYWAAHWDLPSPSQGFEMFQRGIIQRDDLTLLLRALDVQPYWRDKLIQLSYNVTTRVDLRRMYELDLIEEPELKRRLGHQGYSPEDVELVAQFYITEKKFARLAEYNDGRNLTKTEVIGIYGEGIWTREEAFTALTDLHYAAEEANALLDREEYKQQKTLQDARVKLIKERFIDGFITYNEALDQLGKLNLRATHEQKIRLEMELAKDNIRKRPNIKDLLRWTELGFMTLQELEEEILLQGYSKKHAELYRKEMAKYLDTIRKAAIVDRPSKEVGEQSSETD